MTRSSPLPLPSDFTDPETYVESLLSFATSSELFQKLCGGVHILDFFTNEPDLYSTLLPKEWRDWFRPLDISDILDFLMREELGQMGWTTPAKEDPFLDDHKDSSSIYRTNRTWRGQPLPPRSLLEYIYAVRKHLLDRTFKPSNWKCQTIIEPRKSHLSRNLSVGMKPKKIHEVENFAKYIHDLASDIELTSPHSITHYVDFGSGQNYLGRALASNPYDKNVISIESKPHNINEAKNLDVTAKLARKQMVMRNKKEFRKGIQRQDTESGLADANSMLSTGNNQFSTIAGLSTSNMISTQIQKSGIIEYVEQVIQNGNLSSVTDQIQENAEIMVISLHSCGNLLHHGLRSLILNPRVKAVAMVGCCYNLVTERLGPPTHKIPNMRSSNLRLDCTSNSCDADGFPMSDHLFKYEHGQNTGVRFNITARMMAVQAPQNWTQVECESFFTRHFYRALLQRIFLDRCVVEKRTEVPEMTDRNSCDLPVGGEPILIGSLRKPCYQSFVTYTRGALAKLVRGSEREQQIAAQINELCDQEIQQYEDIYKEKKKELSIVWSLMAFSAGVVESVIVIDRWLYLKEQKHVKSSWVETVFEYKKSPRNLVVVGIKD